MRMGPGWFGLTMAMAVAAAPLAAEGKVMISNNHSATLRLVWESGGAVAVKRPGVPDVVLKSKDDSFDLVPLATDPAASYDLVLADGADSAQLGVRNPAKSFSIPFVLKSDSSVQMGKDADTINRLDLVTSIGKPYRVKAKNYKYW